MNKPKLHFYSDCYIFGGCENMIANFLNSHSLNKEFEISFSYRYSVAYQNGLNKRINFPNRRIYAIHGLYAFRWPLLINNRLLRKLSLLLEHFLIKYPAFLYNSLRLYWHFKEKNIDILHINNGGYPAAYSCNSAVLAARICRIKYIIYVVNNIIISRRFPSRWLDYPIDFMVRKFVTQFVTGSKYAGSQLQTILNLPSQQYIVMANGIQRRDVVDQRDSFFNKHELPNTNSLMAVIARLEKRKGHIYLLRALQYLLNNGHSVPTLLIEGVGPEEVYLKKYVVAHNLSDKVRFLGSIERIFDLINAVNFVILPSISNEDFPNVILEAMSLSKPVIATNIAGIPEQIVDNKTGYIVPSKSEIALAEAIKQLSGDKNLREAMGRAARIRYRYFFTTEVAIARYLAFYHSLRI